MYDHYKTVPEPAQKVNHKKRKPKLIAVVDEDNCTGCQVCIPFCPVDCIEPVPNDKYNIPIPPVQIRFDECIVYLNTYIYIKEACRIASVNKQFH